MNEQPLLFSKIRQSNKTSFKLSQFSVRDIPSQRTDVSIPNLFPLSLSPSAASSLSLSKAVLAKTMHVNQDINLINQLRHNKRASRKSVISTAMLLSSPLTPTNRSSKQTSSLREKPNINLKPVLQSESQKNLYLNQFNTTKSTLTSSNPFEIDPDDRIFDILRFQTRKKPKRKPKPPPKEESTPKNRGLTYSKSKLLEVYKEHKSSVLKLNQLKLDKHLPLTHYQNRLIDAITRTISKDSARQMLKTFYKIRGTCNKKYSTNIACLGELEDTEEYIIYNANSQNEEIVDLVKQMGKSKYGRKFKLKEIHFRNVIHKRPNPLYMKHNEEEGAEVTNEGMKRTLEEITLNKAKSVTDLKAY